MKKIVGLAEIMLLSILVFSCQQKDSARAAAKSSAPQAIKMRLGHGGVTSDPRQTASFTFKKVVEAETNGQVSVEVYPASSLGDWREMQEGLQLGSVDIVIEDIGSLQRFNDLAAIGWAAFLYRDRDHFMNVWQGNIGQQILDDVESVTGFKLMGLMYRGARNLNASGKIETLGGINGIKIRVPNSAIAIDTWKALGANPQAMSFTEVFGALQQGVIDAQENPLEVIYNDSIYEVAPYIMLTEHVIGAYQFQFWASTFDSWPANVQKAVRKAVSAASKEYTDGLNAREAKIVDDLSNNPDVEIVSISEAEQSRMAATSKKMLTKKYPVLGKYIEQIENN